MVETTDMMCFYTAFSSGFQLPFLHICFLTHLPVSHGGILKRYSTPLCRRSPPRRVSGAAEAVLPNLPPGGTRRSCCLQPGCIPLSFILGTFSPIIMWKNNYQHCQEYFIFLRFGPRFANVNLGFKSNLLYSDQVPVSKDTLWSCLCRKSWESHHSLKQQQPLAKLTQQCKFRDRIRVHTPCHQSSSTERELLPGCRISQALPRGSRQGW